MYIHTDLSRYVNRIAYKYSCRWSCYGLICIFYDNFISINITTIAIIIWCIRFLFLTIHDNLNFFTVNKHIC